jgi:predicted MPP superfamily phosphohydrolase
VNLLQPLINRRKALGLLTAGAAGCLLEAFVLEPDYFDDLRARRPIALQLSGHTHGGQCRVPLVGYAPRKVDFGRIYIDGHHARDGSNLFVTRGIGTVGLRVRFACPPQLAILTLRSAPDIA